MSYVCVDVDGVLVNFNDALSKHLKHSRGIDFDPAGCIDYNYTYEGLGFDRKVIYECFKEPKLYDYLEHIDGVVPALKKLQGFIKTKAYTGSVDIDEISERRKNLCDSLGLFGEPYTKGRKPTDLGAVALFDDCLGVHKQWIEDGSKALLFLIDAPYNQKTDANEKSLDWTRIIRCKNFEDAVEKFISVYKEDC